MGIVIKVITFPFIWGLRCVMNVFDLAGERRENEESTIGRMVALMPVLVVLYAIGIGIASIISFVKGNGYAEALDIIKEESYLAVYKENLFTKGNIGTFFYRNIFLFFAIAMFITFTFIIVSYIRENSGIKKVFFTFVSILFMISTTMMSIAGIQSIKARNVKNVLDLIDCIGCEYDNIYVSICKKLGVIFIGHTSAQQFIADVVFLTAVISLIILWIMAKYSENLSDIVKMTTDSICVYFIFAPIVVYSAENIFGFGAMILFLLIISLLMIVFGVGVGSSLEHMGNMIAADGYRKKGDSLVKEARRTISKDKQVRIMSEAKRNYDKAAYYDRKM